MWNVIIDNLNCNKSMRIWRDLNLYEKKHDFHYEK